MGRFITLKEHVVFRPQNAVKADMAMVAQFCADNGISLSLFFSCILPAINKALHNFTKFKGGKIVTTFNLGDIILNQKVQHDTEAP